MNEEGREFHREISMGKKEFRVAEDLEKGGFGINGWEECKL